MKRVSIVLFLIVQSAVFLTSQENADFYFNRGLSYANNGNMDAAIADWTKAAALNPNPNLAGALKSNLAEAYFRRGNGNYDERNPDSAFADWDKAIALNSGISVYYVHRGIAYRDKGNLDAAIADWTTAVSIDSNNERVYSNRAAAYYRKGNMDAAIADLTNALAIGPNNSGYYNDRGVMYFAKGNLDAAIADYTRAIAIDTNNAAAYFNRGGAYSAKGNLDAAIADYTSDLTIDTNNATAYFNRGKLYGDKGELDAAIADYTNALAIDANNANAYFNRGNLYDDKGELDAAIADYTKAIVLGFSSAYSAYNNRGLAYLRKGNLDEAIADFTKEIDLKPGNRASAYVSRGLAYRQKGELDEAIADLTSAGALNPNSADVYYERGATYQYKGNRTAAYADWEKALSLNPRHRGVMMGIGTMQAILGLADKAIDTFTMVLAIDPDNAPAYLGRGTEYRKKGNMDEAIADFGKAQETAWKSKDFTAAFAYTWEFAAQIYRDYPLLPYSFITNNTFERKRADIARNGIARGIEQAEKLRLTLGTSGKEIMERSMYFYYAGVDFESLAGNTVKAFEYSEALRSRGFLEQLGTEAALRLPELTGKERTDIKVLLDSIKASQNIIALLNDKANDKVLDETYNKRYADATGTLRAAETALASLDEQLGRRVPRYIALRNPKPVGLAEAQKFCARDTAVIEYVLWDSSVTYNPITGSTAGGISNRRPSINSYCLVLTQNGVTPVRLDPEFDYLKAVNDLRNQIINDTNLSRGLAVISPSAQGQFERTRNSLYDKLIKPVLPHIPANTKNIIIVPDGSLMYLPFDVLRESTDKLDFGETFRLSLSPSVSVSVLAAKTGAIGNEPLLAFGGAVYDRNSAQADRGKRGYTGTTEGRGITVEESALDGGAGKYYAQRLRWLNLPGTEAEVKGLQNLSFSRSRPTIFTGRDVSEKKVKDLSEDGTLKTYPVIHFACHGYFNEETPAMSGIVLSEVSGLVNTGEDGYLTIPEIALLYMDARMVVLSACETGLGQVKRGDGMVGLARSFLVAGARNVGVSLWSISDEATVEFMGRLYRKVIQQNMSFRDAYFAVRGEFRKDSKWGHPFYWAAFTMYE
ncbi:MAG: tetratricopeptide repeat protein [Spirochaetaceae bacterium]|jgi:tetratricopeptide (TPR) repeat protein|nr:tetratricopeptide repeat protein [Spirochaetaceae bacterium]